MTVNTTAVKLWLVVLSVLLAVGCSSTDDVDEDDGPAPLVDFEEERDFDKAWSNSVGDGQGGLYNRLTPAVSGDSVYVAAASGDVEAISLDDGDTQWSIELDKPLSGGVGVGQGVVMLGSAGGEVFALDQKSGDVRWTAQVSGEVLAAPQTDGERVYVQTFDGQMVALDINDGSRVWAFRNTVPVLTLRGTSTPLIYGDAVIAGFANGKVYSFEAATGAVRWEVRVSIAQGNSEIERIADVDAPLLLLNDMIYAVGYQGRLLAIDANTGRRLWARDASSYVGLSEGFGNIYVAATDGSITAFARNGQGVRWAQTVLARRDLTGTATLGSYVITADVEGYVHALSQVDGHIAARVRADSDGVQTQLLVSGDRLLVFGNSGSLIAYELEK